MRLIIAGSRTVRATILEITSYLHEYQIGLKGLEVVSGTAKGIDTDGETFARYYKLSIHRFPADWNKYGKSAGHRRNEQMGDFADALLLIWDGKSKGSAGMKKYMQKIGKSVYEVIID